ncbi:hypothetical protein, partial [Oleiphilus sp. HI0128]
MTLKFLLEQLSIRYSKELYLGYGRSDLYHFLYGYKRFIIEIIRCLLAVLRYPCRKSRISTDTISVYATNNQRKALSSIEGELETKHDSLDIYDISIWFNAARLAVWTSKLFIFPFMFFLSDKREGVYFTCNMRGMVFYNRLLISKIKARGVGTVCISNDHAGDIFIISLLLREVKGIKVVYVQHGAVKDSFPSNQFDSIYVLDNETRDIYRRLSVNDSVDIVVMEQESLQPEYSAVPIDVLVCFSHQFYIVKTITLFRYLSKQSDSSIFVRFHPSDKLAGLKLKVLMLICRVSLSSCDLPFDKDFSRARVVISASSSLLKDAYAKKLAENLIWYKPIGLSWDYYNLESELSVAKNI